MIVHTCFTFIGTQRKGGTIADSVIDACLVLVLEILSFGAGDAFVFRRRVIKAGNSVAQADSVLKVVPFHTGGAFVFLGGHCRAVILGDKLACSISEEEPSFTFFTFVHIRRVVNTVGNSVGQTIFTLQVESIFTRQTFIVGFIISCTIADSVWITDSGVQEGSTWT